jgi:hypothetical protein
MLTLRCSALMAWIIFELLGLLGLTGVLAAPGI